jgi:hypothetical protein
MPGTSGGVRGNINFDVGGEELWQQVGRLAGAVGEIGMKLHIQQAEIQYQDSLLKAEEEILSLSDRLRQNQDEDTYDAELNKSIQSINKFKPKNPLAARDYDAWVKRQTPGWKQDVKKAKEIRLNNKWTAMRDTLAEQAVDTGGLTKLKTHLATGVALGRTNVAAANKYLQTITKKALYEMGINDATANPQVFLESISIKNGKKHSSRHPELATGELMALSNIAEGEIGNIKRRDEIAHAALFDNVTKLGMNGEPFEKVKARIQQTVGISDKIKNKLMSTYASAFSLWDEEKVNAWRITQDYNALFDMQVKISSGQPVSELDILKAQIAGGKVNFSRPDALNLMNQLPDNKSKVLNTPFAKEWAGVIDEMFIPEGQENIPKEDLDEWWKTQLAVQENIKKYHPDISKTQKENEALVKPIKEKKAKSLLRKIVGLHPVVLAARVGMGLGNMIAGKEPPTHVDTLEEAAKLESGKKFEYKGVIYTRK